MFTQPPHQFGEFRRTLVYPEKKAVAVVQIRHQPIKQKKKKKNPKTANISPTAGRGDLQRTYSVHDMYWCDSGGAGRFRGLVDSSPE
jgi:hypothetical protein